MCTKKFAHSHRALNVNTTRTQVNAPTMKWESTRIARWSRLAEATFTAITAEKLR